MASQPNTNGKKSPLPLPDVFSRARQSADLPPHGPNQQNQAMVLQFPLRDEPGAAPYPCLAEAGRECQLLSWVASVWLSGDLIFHSLLGGQQCSYFPTRALSVGYPECPAPTWLNEQTEVHQHSPFFHSSRKLNLYTAAMRLNCTVYSRASWFSLSPTNGGEVPCDISETEQGVVRLLAPQCFQPLWLGPSEELSLHLHLASKEWRKVVRGRLYSAPLSLGVSNTQWGTGLLCPFQQQSFVTSPFPHSSCGSLTASGAYKSSQGQQGDVVGAPL